MISTTYNKNNSSLNKEIKQWFLRTIFYQWNT